MLAKFLGLFGFDLNRQIQLLKERVEDFTREKTDQIKGEVKEIGLMVALAAAGGIMALMTFIIFLMVRAINRLRRQTPPPPPAAPPEEVLLLREIRDAVRK